MRVDSRAAIKTVFILVIFAWIIYAIHCVPENIKESDIRDNEIATDLLQRGSDAYYPE